MIGYMFADLFADVPEADWPALRNVALLSWFNARVGRRFRAQLIERRRASGLSQAQVAECMGVEPPVVYEIEQYDSDPPLSMLQRYATAVGVRIEWRVF